MYPSTIYRVVVKAYITDERNNILVVRESQDFWSLPGGGLEHGESPEDCIKRELREEIGIDNVTVGEIVYSTTAYLDRSDYWMTWVVYKAKIGSNDFTIGAGITDVRYINIKELKLSDDILEKLIVETAQLIA